MTQRDVERALGRLLTDMQFRRAFRSDPALACRAAGFDLSPLELDALMALPFRVLDRVGSRVDERFQRLALPPS